MARGVLAAAKALRDALMAFEPELVEGRDCAAVAEELGLTEKACAAARARAGARAAACGAHLERGFAGAADWLARASGSTTGAAKDALATAEALESCPATKDALVAGELSLAQAHEITKTEAERPGCECELVSVARSESLGTLRDTARKRRLEAQDPEALHRRQHRARAFRHWQDDLGMVCVGGALPPEVGVPFVNRLDAETDRVRRAARREGSDEPRRAHAADAFVRLVAGTGRGKAKGPDLVVVCDLRAYRRGHAHPDEPCHVVGGGPIPVSLARELGRDAFLKAVLHDGTRIETVAHFGRHFPAELRTALEVGAPPEFAGTTCVETGCGRRYGLEWDHDDPVANRGLTAYDNLKPRCWPHHREKTERDRKAGLLSGKGVGRDPPP